MRTLLSTRYITVPDNVKLTVVSRKVDVTGPRGSLTRTFRHKALEITPVGTDGKKLRVDIWFGKKKDLACLRTCCSHIENMMTGVVRGFKYRMRAVYAHFPINMVVDKNEDGIEQVEIRNFLGERRVRKVIPMPGVTVIKATDAKDTLEITGNNIEDVGRTCSLIGQQALVRRKDIRKFLDGIYTESKGHVEALVDQ